MLELLTSYIDIIVICIWSILSVIVYFVFQSHVKQKVIHKARFFIGFLVLSLLILVFICRHIIPSDYFANIVAEVIGIALTVLIIDRVNYYLTDKNNKLHRDISLRHCKMPIYTYCYMWFSIYEINQTTRQTRIQVYNNLNEFFMSDDFYESVCAFNFANLISPNKTYAQYYAEMLNKTEESFQNILAKYASKLSTEDIQRLEFFGGSSYLFRVFRVMDFLRTIQISTQVNNNPATPEMHLPILNRFTTIDRNNFQKHFRKLLELINNYNLASNINDQWTISTLNTLTNLGGPNANNYDW